MGIVSLDAVNRSQGRNHDFFGGRAGNDGDADLPVITERCDDRFDEVA